MKACKYKGKTKKVKRIQLSLKWNILQGARSWSLYSFHISDGQWPVNTCTDQSIAITLDWSFLKSASEITGWGIHLNLVSRGFLKSSSLTSESVTISLKHSYIALFRTVPHMQDRVESNQSKVEWLLGVVLSFNFSKCSCLPFFCSYIALLTNIQSITPICFSKVSVPSHLPPATYSICWKESICKYENS